MGNYLKLFNNHDEYESTENRGVFNHCINEVHIHYNDRFDYGSDDEDPGEEDYDLDAGYFG